MIFRKFGLSCVSLMILKYKVTVNHVPHFHKFGNIIKMHFTCLNFDSIFFGLVITNFETF